MEDKKYDRYYSIVELSKHDDEIRKSAIKICSTYSIPSHMLGDFVNDGYLKAQRSYFDKDKYCTIGGMLNIITCLILDYLKKSSTKNTFRGDRLPQDFKNTKNDTTCENEFINLDFTYYDDVDYEYEYKLDREYREKIFHLQQLPQAAFEIIYYTTLLPIQQVSNKTGLSVKELRSSRKKIIEYLKSLDDNEFSLIKK